MSALWNRLPLPAEHVVAMLAGLVLQARDPSRRLPESVARAGWLLLGAGVALNAWAVLARGSGDIEHPDRLVTAGPYGYVRHPMYVGWSLVHLGSGLATRSVWMVATWPAAFGVLHRAVLREERHLAAEFGTETTDYARSVPRYLPRLRPPASSATE
jgi:protein-S-isoprenylcysteine O-methyltransferase Ste14